MRQQKEDLIASYRQDVSTRNSAASPTHPMIERGKMILAETEARSEILSRYTSFQNSMNMTPTSTPQHRTIAPDLPMESPYSREEGVACEEVGSNSDNEELLTEDEARAKLRELIATMNHNRGDVDDGGLNTLTTKSFDPSSMNTAKVAVQRKAKFDEALAAAEAESRLMTSFKALPLPSGAEVKHNIFAPTQAFQGKQVGGPNVKHDPTSNDNYCNYAPSTLLGSSSFRALDDSLSVPASMTSHDDDGSFDAASSGILIVRTEADKEQAKQLMADRKMKKKQIIDEVDRIVMGEDASTAALIAESTAAAGTSGQEASCDMSVVVEDPSKLLQDIAHLKAKFKQKKTDRLAILNDIVDIDLNAPFDRLLPGTVVGDEIWCIIDRLKKQVCGGIADYDSNHAYSNRQETSNLPHKMSASPLPTTNNHTPIFIRQQQWAKQREQKLLNGRLQKEADAMNGITGVPQISDATQSWKQARESHDETLRRVAEEDAKKQQVREAKEKALREELVKEVETKEVEAAKTLITNEADNEERQKRIESLARPRQVRAVIATSMNSCNSKHEEHEQQHPPTDLPSKSKIFLSPKPKKKKMPRAILSVYDKGRTDLASSSEYPPSNLTSADTKPDKFCGMNSFAEMSDKEFVKLIKNIGKGKVSFLNDD